MSWHVVHILKEKHIAKGEQEKDKQIMKSLLENMITICTEQWYWEAEGSHDNQA